MTRIYISIAYITISIAALWNMAGIHSKAMTREEALEDIYEQLVVEKKEEAVVTDVDDKLSVRDIELYMSEKDDDRIFNGTAILTAGIMYSARIGDDYTVCIKNMYDIDEADRLTDEMIKEIPKTAVTDREKMTAICKYISDTFTYELNEETDGSGDFVKAYYGDRKMICMGYADLTYILARKMGIDCEIVFGTNHAYNVVKFDDSDNWIIYDLARESRYAQVDRLSYIHNNRPYITDYTEDIEEKEYLDKHNSAKPVGTTASIADYIRSFLYLALKAHCAEEMAILAGIVIYIAAIIAIAVKKRKDKAAHKRALAKRFGTAGA